MRAARLLPALLLISLAWTCPPAAAADKDKPKERIEVRVFLKVTESGKKYPLAGARVEHFSDDKWRDFGGAGAKSKASFSSPAGGGKGHQANYSGRGRVPVTRGQRALLFRVAKKGYGSGFFAVDNRRGKAKPSHYREISLEPHGPVCSWPLNDGEGESARETVGKGKAGKISGATWPKESGRAALKLDGEDDFVDCGTSPAYECGEAITVLLWVKPPERISTRQGLVGRAWSNPYSLSTVKDNGLHASVFLWSIGRVYLLKRNVIKPGQWNLVGFSYGDYRLSLFHNGKKVHEGASFGRGKTREKSSLEGQLRRKKRGVRLTWDRYAQPYRIHGPSGQPLSIGYFDGAAPFKGAMRGVRIYNYALNEKEVAKVYKAQGGK